MAPAFAMLACETDLPSPGYVLYIETSESDGLLEGAAARIENGLQENFHYQYARQLGQLAALRMFRAEDADEAYLAAGVRNGFRAGDIKPLALTGATGGPVFSAAKLLCEDDLFFREAGAW